ncbi:MAG: type II toxin-antitoxin system RelE/ParE family toxin [Burkholderiales bacterium]
MALRLKFSARALHEVGEAREWYEMQNPRLGEEFIAAMELQVRRLEQSPMLYAEIIPGIRRAFLPRFPYGLFYTVSGDIVHILAVLHEARNPNRWPRNSR